MSTTIYYRGTMADADRVEELEDRVIDMSLEIGAVARIWRSWPGDDPSRVVRGLLLDVAPGQMTTSLLISPEGWLIPQRDVAAAERGQLSDRPFCSVETQFGSIEGHVALVELLAYLKQEFVPDLEVRDEGGYWEHRDVRRLMEVFQHTLPDADSGTDDLRFGSLTGEATEDPAIIAARLGRVAEQVQRALQRPPEHPPVRFDGGRDWDELNEADWDESYKEQRRKQEWLSRAIQEQLRAGADPSSALDRAMQNEGITGLPGEIDEDHVTDSLEPGGFNAESFLLDAAEEDEPWRESLESDWQADDPPWADAPPPDELAPADEFESHPLQRLASDLHLRTFELFNVMDPDAHSSYLDTLMHGAGEIGGGLAQALSEHDTELEGLERGLAVVQLKRALRGAAFAAGALVGLRAESALKHTDCDELQAMIRQLREGILAELARLRDEWPQ